MKLSTKLTSLMLLLAIVPLLVVGYLAYQQGREALERATLANLESTAMLKADSFSLWLEDGARGLRALARRPLLRQYAATLGRMEGRSLSGAAARSRLLADHFAPSLAEEETFLALSLVDATSGRVLVTTDEALADADLSGVPLITRGRVETTVETTGSIGSGQDVAAYVATPVTGGAGQTVAVLLGQLNLERMTEIVHQTNDAVTRRESYLVNGDGEFLTRPPLAEVEVLAQKVASEGARACIQGRSGSAFYDDYRGVPVLGAYRWLPQAELCLLTEMDAAVAVAPTAALRLQVWRLATVLAGMILVAGLLFSRSLTRPLSQLLQGTRRIGAGNLTYRIPVGSRDEIGQVAEAFNQMADNLRASIGQTAHGRRLLLALSEAGQAVQRAHTPDEVYEALGREVEPLGFNAAVTLFTAPGQMRFAYVGVDSQLVRAAERLTGLSPENHVFQVGTSFTFDQITKERKAIYCETLAPCIAELLPADKEQMVRQAMSLLGIRQAIVAPLAVEDEVLGVLIIAGEDLGPADVPAVQALAAQTAIALQNAHLYERLRREEARYRAIFEGSGSAIFVVDVTEAGEFRFADVNPAYQRLSGLEADVLLGKTLAELVPLIPAEAAAAVEERYAACVAAGDTVSYEQMVPIRGEESWWLTRLSPQRDAAGCITRLIGTSLSITRRKQAEDALRRHRQELETLVAERTAALRRERDRFNRLLETSPVGIIFVDRKGEITFANPQAEQVLALSLDEASGRTYNAPSWQITDFEGNPFPEDELPFARVRHSGQAVYNVEHAIHKPDGPPVYLSVNAAPVFDAQGAFDGLVATVQDVGEQKAAAEELRHQEALLSNVLAHLPVGVWIMDRTGKIVEGNPAALEIWGGARYVGPEEYGLYKSWWVDSGEPVAPGEWAALRALRQGERTLDEEIAIEAFDGERKILLSSAIPLREEEKITGALIVNQDVTRLKQAQAQAEAYAAELARSNEELQQFAYVASHDLQEPLRMVTSFLQLLQRRYAGQLDEDADEYIYFAVDGATRMKGLINDLLRYSRVSTQGKPLEPVESEQLLETVLHDLQLVIAESEATINYDTLPVVMADPTQLRQLLQNLIGNALKFRGDAPAEVTISAERDNGQWTFAVQDEGIGLSPEHAERIFVIFQRLHAGSTYRGTGIGLAICKKIVERHGGQIWVESAEGKGATFYFTLPAVSPETPPV